MGPQPGSSPRLARKARAARAQHSGCTLRAPVHVGARGRIAWAVQRSARKQHRRTSARPLSRVSRGTGPAPAQREKGYPSPFMEDGSPDESAPPSPPPLLLPAAGGAALAAPLLCACASKSINLSISSCNGATSSLRGMRLNSYLPHEGSPSQAARTPTRAPTPSPPPPQARARVTWRVHKVHVVLEARVEVRLGAQ